MLLTKEQMTQRAALSVEDVEVPELGGTVRLRAWTGSDYDAFAAAIAAFKFDGSMYAAAIAASAVNENGDRVFDMNGDVQRIAAAWSKTTLEGMYERIRRLNKLGKEGVEEAAKN